MFTFPFIFSGNFYHKRARFFPSSSYQKIYVFTDDRFHYGNLSLDIINLHLLIFSPEEGTLVSSSTANERHLLNRC